jgi:hypothetical protein
MSERDDLVRQRAELLERIEALERDAVSGGIEAVKAEGQAIVARRELQMASPEWPRLQAASERVRKATIRFLETADGPGRVEAEIELTEAKIAHLELEERVKREW